MDTSRRLRVFITVGTDHHPFDRVVAWADALALNGDVEVVVQYGTSRPPTVAQGFGYLPHPELTELIKAAQVVVCHGGPATIMQVRDAGKVPLVIARDPSLGEHVDAHQLRFVARVAADEKVISIGSASELVDVVAAVGSGAMTLGVQADEPELSRVVHLVGDLIDALVGARHKGGAK